MLTYCNNIYKNDPMNCDDNDNDNDNELANMINDKCNIESSIDIFEKIIIEDFKLLVLYFIKAEEPFLLCKSNKYSKKSKFNIDEYIEFVNSNYLILVKNFINEVKKYNIDSINLISVKPYIDYYIDIVSNGMFS